MSERREELTTEEEVKLINDMLHKAVACGSELSNKNDWIDLRKSMHDWLAARGLESSYTTKDDRFVETMIYEVDEEIGNKGFYQTDFYAEGDFVEVKESLGAQRAIRIYRNGEIQASQPGWVDALREKLSDKLIRKIHDAYFQD